MTDSQRNSAGAGATRPMGTMLGRALRGDGGFGLTMGGNPNLTVGGELGDNIKRMEAAEKQAKHTDSSKSRLLTAAQNEMALKLNRVKVFDKWREHMRRLKSVEMRKLIDVLGQNHERSVTRKNLAIENLLGDLKTIEGQFLVSQRAHLQYLDELIEVHKQRQLAMEERFEADLSIVKREFEEERSAMLQKHLVEKKELRATIKEAEMQQSSFLSEVKQTHETEREEVKNKNLDIVNVLKVTLDSKIDELERKFDDAHRLYIEKTEDKSREFRDMQHEDKRLSKQIEQILKQVQKLQVELQQWRHKISQTEKEAAQRNDTVRREKHSVHVQHRALKGRMKVTADTQARKLLKLSLMSQACVKRHKQSLERAGKILKMAELCRKFENEEERVAPFDRALDCGSASLWVPGGIPGGEEQDGTMAVESGEGGEYINLEASTGMVDRKRAMLVNHYKRYNQGLLDKICLERKYEGICAENARLRSALKQYLSGITVSKESMEAGSNPTLLVVQGISNRAVPNRRK